MAEARRSIAGSGRWAVAAVAALLASAASAGAQTIIALRPDARVEPGAPVRLADIADLAGPEAAALAALTLPAHGPDVPRATATIADVRAALREHGVDPAVVVIRGASCTLVGAPPAAPVPAAPPAPTPDPQKPTAPAMPTVRDAVAEQVCLTLGVNAEDIRIGFDASDADLLGLSAAGRLVEVRPVGASERWPLAVTVYQGDRIVASRTIRVDVHVRRRVAVLAMPKRRGETIGPDDVTTGEQWLAPNATPADPAQIIGAAARSRLRAGQVVQASDVEPPLAAAKGDLVAVHCISGGIVLRTLGRALHEARDGEVVRLEPAEGPARGGTGRTFYARMSGRRRAVAVVGPAPDAALEESR